jgi:hypothetical protein
MVGVNRRVYRKGVYQGQDLFDQRTSLIQYADLFNAFPEVTFCISVLSSGQNQELVSYSWIFPNVVTSGHWWYSNIPAYVEQDARARLHGVPKTKQIGYYSDMYKLEFALPKFAMFKRILAKVLAECFVIDRGWTEEQVVELGKQVLRGNVETMFRWNENLRNEIPDESELEPLSTNAPLGPISPALTEEAMSINHPVPFESERLERLPDPPAKQFVRPVPEDLPNDEIQLEGNNTSSGNEPPQLEVIDDPGK